MNFQHKIRTPENIRPPKKKTRFWVDNEILEKYAQVLKPQGIAVYCALARHANSKTQGCFPAYERLMEMSGVGNRNTLSKYLKILEKYNLIGVFRNNIREVNVYFMLNVEGGSRVDSSTIKDNRQYLKSSKDGIKRDTLNLINKSNKEINAFDKEDIYKPVDTSKYKPKFMGGG